MTYNSRDFIENDPVSIPHQYSIPQDIEIAAFWVAMLSWGQRVTIINKARELMNLMDNAPYDFIVNHGERDRRAFLAFKHRTFQPDDTIYFLHFLQRFYKEHSSLEEAFCFKIANNVRESLIHFHNLFFNDPVAMQRTRKHVSTPARNSSCKRLNMFLRWMVRQDDKGVDFGLWRTIHPSQLMIPLDVHVFKVARQLGLLKRDRSDWQAVEELTSVLAQFDASDPVKYDFALFSLGLDQRGHDLPL